MSTHSEKRCVPILMYHSISDEAGPKFRPFIVPPALFAEQMKYLYFQGYTPLTVSQFVSMRSLGEGALPSRPIVITFDDALADFISDALPVLRYYGFPATLYVPTAYVNDTSHWMQRIGEGMRRLLTWEQLREVSRSGIECGAHTHSHPQLDLLLPHMANDEIVRSKQILEERLDQEISSMAYPYGYYTAAVQRFAREAGYSSACSVKYAMSTTDTDVFALARLLVGPETTIQAFAALLDGHDRRVTTAAYTRPLAPVWRFVRFCSSLAQGA